MSTVRKVDITDMMMNGIKWTRVTTYIAKKIPASLAIYSALWLLKYDDGFAQWNKNNGSWLILCTGDIPHISDNFVKKVCFDKKNIYTEILSFVGFVGLWCSCKWTRGNLYNKYRCNKILKYDLDATKYKTVLLSKEEILFRIFSS